MGARNIWPVPKSLAVCAHAPPRGRANTVSERGQLRWVFPQRNPGSLRNAPYPSRRGRSALQRRHADGRRHLSSHPSFRLSRNLSFSSVIPTEVGIHHQRSAPRRPRAASRPSRLARTGYVSPRSTRYLHRATGNGCPQHLACAKVTCSLRSRAAACACEQRDGKRPFQMSVSPPKPGFAA